jgi:hypothetical protein
MVWSHSSPEWQRLKTAQVKNGVASSVPLTGLDTNALIYTVPSTGTGVAPVHVRQASVHRLEK